MTQTCYRTDADAMRGDHRDLWMSRPAISSFDSFSGMGPTFLCMPGAGGASVGYGVLTPTGAAKRAHEPP